MAYINGKSVLFATIRNGEKAQETYYEFFVKPEDQADGTAKVWEAVSATKFKVKIYATEFDLTNPYIDAAIVYQKDENGKTICKKAILDHVLLLNGDMVVYTNELINCKIILKGDTQ